jgi:hypothetical protein
LHKMDLKACAGVWEASILPWGIALMASNEHLSLLFPFHTNIGPSPSEM